VGGKLKSSGQIAENSIRNQEKLRENRLIGPVGASFEKVAF